MESSLRIDLFGPIRVLVDGDPMPRVRSRKALWLLALLTLREGQPAAREWVADALWPDAESGQGLANLRPLISELRSALGSQSWRLLANDGTVSLDLDDATVDVLEFDAAIKREEFTRAIELYRGELLEGCSEEWVIQEQRVRETNCLAALQSLGDSALAGGQFNAAVDFFTRAIGIDPLRDAPRRGLMAALSTTGDVNAALQSYREFARLLSAEVSTSPDKETTRLYDQLRADLRRPVKQTKPTPNNLIQPLSGLVGREDEGADVEDLLRKNRLVTLTGVGGIGKTRLSLSVASAVLPEYPEGVWFVGLEAVEDGRAVSGTVAAELGVQDVSTRPLVAGIVERLRDGRCLLILDNCEHLLDAVAELVLRLLRECPELHILGTSREALDITGEAVWFVPPLAFPTEANLPEGRTTRRRVARDYESVRLFVERAKSVQPEFELTDENLGHVIDVCAQVEGLPLAIELAAARIRSMSMEALKEQLQEHHLETLQGRARGQNPRQSALRATIDWSYVLLDEDDRRLMARLSVFAGGWTLEAAERVCQAKNTLEQLRHLVEKSIIMFDGRTERYRFLEPVRQYAAEKLAESGEADGVLADYRTWCIEFAIHAEPRFRGGEQAEWLRLADQEWPNLRKALDQGDQDPNLALGLAGAVWYYWYIRSTRENYRYLKETLAREGADEPLARAEVLLGLGVLTYSDREYDASREALDQSLAIFQSIGDKRGAGRVLTILGNLASVVEGFREAIDYYEKSLVLLKEATDLSSVAQTLGNLAMFAAQLDDYSRARRYYEEGLAAARELGSDRSLAYLLRGLANMAQRQGEWQAYAGHEQKALELFRGFGDKRGMAACLRQQGAGERRNGITGPAILKFEESLRLYREIGDTQEEAYTATYLARAIMDTGDLSASEALVRQALEMFGDGFPHGQAECAYVLCMIMGRKGDAGRSWDYLMECITIWTEVDYRSGIADALDRVAEQAAIRCEDGSAAFFFGASEALREELGVPRLEIDEPDYQQQRGQARIRFGAARFDQAVDAGRATPWPEAAERAKELMA